MLHTIRAITWYHVLFSQSQQWRISDPLSFSPTGEYHLRLHDLTGSLVKEKSIETLDELRAAQIDLNPLPAGTYLVFITGHGGIYLRKKLVITE